MDRALTAAATGLQAQQTNIERISTDIANVNTDGYKRSRNEFYDLMYQTVKEPGAQLGASTSSPVGIQKGMGVQVGAQYKVFEQGTSKMTYRPYDFLIEGKGFFQIQLPTGEIAYTRAGIFRPDQNGRLVSSSGAMLIPQVTIPSTAIKIVVTPAGEFRAHMPNGEVNTIGQMQLFEFQNRQGLDSAGSSIFMSTRASGPPVQALPGENGMGVIRQGAVEGSNVNVANSMVDMISTQRAYEMNTKVMGVADRMMEATVNIR